MEKISIFKYSLSRFKEDKLFSTIILSFFAICLGSSIYFFINLRVTNALLSLVYSLFIIAMFLIEYFVKIKFPPLFLLVAEMLAVGGLLGSCYDFYSFIPFFDNILHTIAGFIFACLGYSVMDSVLKKKGNTNNFLPCMLFAFTFTLSIAVFWELFEYTINSLLGFDMMEDTLINNFNSYYISGTHNEIFSVNDITNTIIYYGDNQILSINGYLDIGLIDTITDTIVCLLGGIIFVILTVISHFKIKKINELLFPVVIDK